MIIDQYSISFVLKAIIEFVYNKGGIFTLKNIVFILGIPLLMIVLVICYNRYSLKKNKYTKDRSASRFDYIKRSHRQNGPLSLPGNHEQEIAQAIIPGDSHFSGNGLIQYVKTAFCLLQQGITDGDLSSARLFLHDEYYQKQKDLLLRFQKSNIVLHNDVLQIPRLYLHLFQHDTKNEFLTLFATVNMVQYSLDASSNELLDGSQQDKLRFYYFITVTRSSDTKTSHNGEPSAKCPQCGSMLNITEDGNCFYCHAHLTDGHFGWVIQNITRISDFSETDERGVVYY